MYMPRLKANNFIETYVSVCQCSKPKNIYFLSPGCEAHPDVNLHHKKYGIKLYIPGADGMEEIWLRFESVSIILWMNDDFINVMLPLIHPISSVGNAPDF